MVQSALQHLAGDLIPPAEICNGDEIVDFRALAENIPHIVWAAGADGATTYFNQRGSILQDCHPKQISDGVGCR